MSSDPGSVPAQGPLGKDLSQSTLRKAGWFEPRHLTGLTSPGALEAAGLGGRRVPSESGESAPAPRPPRLALPRQAGHMPRRGDRHVRPEPAPRALSPFPRTQLVAGSTPRRHLLGSSASSTSGTASSVHKRSSISPTAPRTCRATSSPGWTTTWTCSEGLPSGRWRPARSVSLTCSHPPLGPGGRGRAVPLMAPVELRANFLPQWAGGPRSPPPRASQPEALWRHLSPAYLFRTTILLVWGGEEALSRRWTDS